jgi:hypothetical protein
MFWFTLSFFSVGSGCHLARSEIVLKSGARRSVKKICTQTPRSAGYENRARYLRGGTAMMPVNVFGTLNLDPKAVSMVNTNALQSLVGHHAACLSELSAILQLTSGA